MQARSVALMLFAALLAGNTARADGVIKIGDINSYKAMAANMGPYRKAVDLAVEQINSAGGVLGKKIEIVSRDDGANPGDAVRMALEKDPALRPATATAFANLLAFAARMA